MTKQEQKKRNYYIVYDDSYGQHGSYIEDIYLTLAEYRKMKNNSNKNYFITNKYITALYYVQD